MIDSSMPYICCGGTVAITCAVASAGHKLRNAARFCAVLMRKLLHVLGFADGRPVLPEVKPIAANASGST